MTVVTRFAPSPTGFLHIGGARTALFNWLYAKHHQGKFLLRIEDTDRERSSEAAVEAIFDSLKWLSLDWDEEPVFQFSRAARHAEVALDLLKQGKAYYCYCSPEELEQMREEARKNGGAPRYNGFWRDRDQSLAPVGVKPVVRFKAPQEGETMIEDSVQGTVRIQNSTLDDMVLLRADGTPTYMLSVVVDDHDMGITHIIRGDDHLTNAFRQTHLYLACGWDIPQFSHLPLIHGPDGAKLSKRHGALGADAYRDMGFLPEALCNYLLRLGWGHGDDEIITRAQAIEWFDGTGIGKSPARLDLAKLTNLNAHYIRETGNARLVELIQPHLTAKLGRELEDTEINRLLHGMNGLKQRAKTLIDLANASLFYCEVQPIDEKAAKFTTSEAKALVKAVADKLENVTDFTESAIDATVRIVSEEQGEKLGNIAQPLRVALTGSTISPSVFEVMEVLGKEETLNRLKVFILE
ncbi:glutamate--tRNA ligase [Candidatus Paracaedibacter symbiosus]|uniref:glutamate--tRNA ligase n=1 Tax=Candidatus Paracaedibacter symbiosus TaxID=244582 RepID=UPI000509A9EE|nr:glutamate--tRNA ligase [Candidatus Paracaedibacter symbiosus]